MARTPIPVNVITRTGITNASITPVTGDPANNHSLTNDGGCWLEVTNTNGSSTAHTLTAHIPQTVDGQAVTSRAYSIPAGATTRIGPFSPGTYGAVMQIDVDNAELHLTAWRI